jgi:hypothetical protein
MVTEAGDETPGGAVYGRGGGDVGERAACGAGATVPENQVIPLFANRSEPKR